MVVCQQQPKFKISHYSLAWASANAKAGCTDRSRRNRYLRLAPPMSVQCCRTGCHPSTRACPYGGWYRFPYPALCLSACRQRRSPSHFPFYLLSAEHMDRQGQNESACYIQTATLPKRRDRAIDRTGRGSPARYGRASAHCGRESTKSANLWTEKIADPLTKSSYGQRRGHYLRI
jgi:hypothetical protein